jgi:PKD repeat protein
MPDGSIVLMGGFNDTALLNDLWRSTDKGQTWAQVQNAGWSGRFHHTSVAMPDGSIVLMGGLDDSAIQNDTWRFQPAGSSQQSPSHTYTTAGIYSATLQAFNAAGYSSIQKVSAIVTPMQPVPPSVNAPRDLNNDGLYEDIDGNGVLDFNDVVLFFNQMDWIAGNEPVGAFDFNRNGRIDFDDIVIVFNEL